MSWLFLPLVNNESKSCKRRYFEEEICSLWSFFFSFPDTFEMVSEDEDGKVMFKVNYHYMSQVKNASDTNSAARSRRLAQEAVTLSTSLPLSSSSSVFVRCDEERLDIMKVLIYNNNINNVHIVLNVAMVMLRLHDIWVDLELWHLSKSTEFDGKTLDRGKKAP